VPGIATKEDCLDLFREIQKMSRARPQEPRCIEYRVAPGVNR
jgi:hypothetical protein